MGINKSYTDSGGASHPTGHWRVIGIYWDVKQKSLTISVAVYNSGVDYTGGKNFYEERQYVVSGLVFDTQFNVAGSSTKKLDAHFVEQAEKYLAGLTDFLGGVIV